MMRFIHKCVLGKMGNVSWKLLIRVRITNITLVLWSSWSVVTCLIVWRLGSDPWSRFSSHWTSTGGHFLVSGLLSGELWIDWVMELADDAINEP